MKTDEASVTAPKATLRTEVDIVRPAQSIFSFSGNPYWVNQETLFGFDEVNASINGAGKPTFNNRYIFIGAEGNYSNFARTTETMTYDQSVRLKTIAHTMTNATTSTNISMGELANMTYNFKDQLTVKKVGKTGTKYLQSTNYAYNSRNWLTNINPDPSTIAANTLDYPVFNATDAALTNAA
ncbi:MAG: hypothetical protein U5L45_16315 [Saprospiraceae bacterium]|nr:hypothetical protein [Saprospiraceae bacterium]